MSTEVATTGASFTGADVDGLDHLAQEFNGAAEIVDMVKMACEVIVAAASIFGPFGAAFVAYLKGTVIPWLTKISSALKAMSKVLSMHSAAQKDASSSATSLPPSLPSYQGTPNLPTTSTHDAPALPPAATVVTPTTPAAPAGPGASVATPPTIGGTTPATSTSPTTATATGDGVTPFVQAVTALTGLVTAVDHLIHPGSGSSGGTTPAPGGGVPAPGGDTPSGPTAPTAPTTPTTPTDPGGTTPTDPGTTPTDPGTTPTDPGTTPTTPADPGGTTPSDPATPTVPGTAPVLGSVGGIDLSTLHPLHPGDTVGVLSVPVDIAPDGTVTPLIHSPLDPAPTPETPAIPGDSSTAPAAIAPSPHHADTPVSSGGSGGGTSGGGFGGGSGGGSEPSAPVITSAPPADATTTAAHPAAAAAQAEPGLRTETIGSHDGLFTGVGQATGIGAGAAALARAVLSEAKQSGDGSMLGAVPMPFDAEADGAARTEIFQGSIG